MANESQRSKEDRSPSESQGLSSGMGSTQSRGRNKTREGAGGGIESGRPDRGANRSGGQGNVSQQSNVSPDGGAPSRQTSTASEESGQL